jgi:nicotinate dehydrogenase subunit B
MGGDPRRAAGGEFHEWTDWKGLPGSPNLFKHLRADCDWRTTPVTKSDKTRGAADPAIAPSAKKLQATYEMPFMKHAPIRPMMALADGSPRWHRCVYTHSQNPQELRGEIAQMLGTSIDNVVVRVYAGPGHYGRSNGSNAGAEDEAVILSKAVGKPVRMQWMRPEDLTCGSCAPIPCRSHRAAVPACVRVAGHSVWSTAFIRSSFIRPPCTSMLERAVSISRSSVGVS